LDTVAAELKQRLGGRALAGVLVDDSFFASEIVVPGAGYSDNPFDAPNSATGVNFNTINVRREDGKIVSAEAQTPLTPLALSLARQRTFHGDLRINLGNADGNAGRYAAELIAAKLRSAGVRVGDKTG